MVYQVIARKHRPQRFADAVGQEHVTQTLANAIAQNRIAHAYLFCGPRGTGKTSGECLARSLKRIALRPHHARLAGLPSGQVERKTGKP